MQEIVLLRGASFEVSKSVVKTVSSFRLYINSCRYSDFNLRHAKISDLHKRNLAAALGTDDGQGGSSGASYRDRAKERRLKFGTEQEVASNSLKVCVLFYFYFVF